LSANLFAAILWIVAIIATHDADVANTACWIGLIIGMVAIQADAEMRA
jgi:hypothetical protein